MCMGFPSKNAGAGCRFLLQGIFPTQGSNPISCVSYTAGRFFPTSATWGLPSVPHSDVRDPLSLLVTK